MGNKSYPKKKFDISSLDDTAQGVNFSDIVNAEILVIQTFALLLERQKIFFQFPQMSRKIANSAEERNDLLFSRSSFLNAYNII